MVRCIIIISSVGLSKINFKEAIVKKFFSENGRHINYCLRIKVRHGENRPQSLYLDEWSKKGNPYYETMTIHNWVRIENYDKNVRVWDLREGYLSLIKQAYIKEPGTLEFSWPYEIFIEIFSPETGEKVGYLIYFEKENETCVSMLKEIIPDKDSSLRQKLRDLGFLNPITGNYIKRITSKPIEACV